MSNSEEGTGGPSELEGPQGFGDTRLEEEQARYRSPDQVIPSEKAEVINGQIVFHPPVMLKHNQVRMNLSHLMAAYVRKHKLGLIGEETLFVSLPPNNYGPDIVFFSSAKTAELKPEQMRFPAPDLIVEILAPTTENLDRGLKFRDYAANGVAEYWLVDPTAEFVEQYENLDGRYSLLFKGGADTMRSLVLTGFEIPVRAVFDPSEHLAALQRIVLAPEPGEPVSPD